MVAGAAAQEVARLRVFDGFPEAAGEMVDAALFAVLFGLAEDVFADPFRARGFLLDALEAGGDFH